jgi:Ca-activated chloride channel family protein
VCRGAPTNLEVLVRITPPLPDVHIVRPTVNLGIVLDRSGSMSEGQKMGHAREAAIFAVRQLLPTDRLSITVFDDQIETIAASAPVTNKADLVARIKRIGPRNSTALHGGWSAGAQQVLEHLAWQGLNRVLLLSDGLANVGLTDPAAICGEVRAMAAREVSTSTIGVGKDYNEDLLGAMALAGQGNYYYVQSSIQLTDIFQTELQGLMATTGRNVALTVRPGAGVSVREVLTELERGPSEQIMLPDLVSDMPVSVLIRLNIAASQRGGDLAAFHLAWNPAGEDGGRQGVEVALSLPSVPLEEWEKMPLDPAVEEQLALIMATKARDEFRAALQRGEAAGAQKIIDRIRQVLAAGPATQEILADVRDWNAAEELLKQGELTATMKAAHYMGHYRKQGRGAPPPQKS